MQDLDPDLIDPNPPSLILAVLRQSLALLDIGEHARARASVSEVLRVLEASPVPPEALVWAELVESARSQAMAHLADAEPLGGMQ